MMLPGFMASLLVVWFCVGALLYRTQAVSLTNNATLEVSSKLPGDFCSPVLMRLRCEIPKGSQDGIVNITEMSLETRKGNTRTKLASITEYTLPESMTFDGIDHVDGDGQLSGDSGFLSVAFFTKRELLDVDEYSCVIDYQDTKGDSNTIIVSDGGEKVRFFSLIADEFSNVIRRVSHAKANFDVGLSRLGAKIATIEAKFKDEVSRVDEKINGGLKIVDSKIDVAEAKFDEVKANFSSDVSRIEAKIEDGLSSVDAKIAAVKANFSDMLQEATNCAALRHKGHVTSARQKVTWSEGTQVLCDTQTDGGGWTIFQRRKDGNVPFYRDWEEYENGFGDLNSDFWLGLRQLNHLMHEGPQELRIDLKINGQDLYAHYSFFHVDDFRDNYRLRVKGYSGTAFNSLSWHDNARFTTYDNDHDGNPNGNCAVTHIGAWWYNNCLESNLNGVWGSTVPAKGFNWLGFDRSHLVVSFSEMKTRPLFGK